MVHATSETIILDNGAYSVRVGTSRDADPRFVQILIFENFSSSFAFFYPFLLNFYLVDIRAFVNRYFSV